MSTVAMFLYTFKHFMVPKTDCRHHQGNSGIKFLLVLLQTFLFFFWCSFIQPFVQWKDEENDEDDEDNSVHIYFLSFRWYMSEWVHVVCLKVEYLFKDFIAHITAWLCVSLLLSLSWCLIFTFSQDERLYY